MSSSPTGKPSGVLTSCLIWGGGIVMILAIAWMIWAASYSAYYVASWPGRANAGMTIVAILNALPILVIGGLPALAGHILRRWGLRRRAAERFATNLD